MAYIATGKWEYQNTEHSLWACATSEALLNTKENTLSSVRFTFSNYILYKEIFQNFSSKWH